MELGGGTRKVRRWVEMLGRWRPPDGKNLASRLELQLGGMSRSGGQDQGVTKVLKVCGHVLVWGRVA